jgi:hypothetical protein
MVDVNFYRELSEKELSTESARQVPPTAIGQSVLPFSWRFIVLILLSNWYTIHIREDSSHSFQLHSYLSEWVTCVWNCTFIR